MASTHNCLKDLVATYIRGNILLAGDSTLKVINEGISIFKDDDYFDGIREELEARNRTIQGVHGTEMPPNPLNLSRRKKVEGIVDQLMMPDQSIWTDEETGSTDLVFAQLCLEKLKLRFER